MSNPDGGVTTQKTGSLQKVGEKLIDFEALIYQAGQARPPFYSKCQSTVLDSAFGRSSWWTELIPLTQACGSWAEGRAKSCVRERRGFLGVDQKRTTGM